MTELNIALTAVGGLILVLGLLSRPINTSVLSMPLMALLAGVLLGPAGLALLQPGNWGHAETLLEEAARVTLAISLMGIALRLPPSYPLRHWRPLLVLLGIGMPLMCLAGTLLAYGILGLPILAALLVGATLSPTEPVVASAIVTGDVAEENLPGRVRHLLSTESAANDGLAYPLVLLPVLLLTQAPETAWVEWLWRALIWGVGGAALFGALLGLGAGRLLRWAERQRLIGEQSFLSVTIALSLLVLGAAKLLGMDGILAVLAAGVAFDQEVGGRERSEEENVQEAVNQFFTLPVFVLVGVMLPWEHWLELGWGGLLLAAAVLLLRRLPAMVALTPFVSPLQARRDTLFAGWFGPVGVAAVFYAMLVLRHTGNDIAWTVGSLVVCASVLVHGISAAPLARLYGRYAHNDDRG